MLDLKSLRDQIKTGQKRVYSSDREEVGFFDLRKEESYNKTKDRYEATVRIVVPPESKGFAYRIIHPNVGRPGKDTKVFACPSYVGEVTGKKLGCDICELLEAVADPEVGNKKIDWTIMKDGYPVKGSVELRKAVQEMSPQHLLLMNVVEPLFFDDEDAAPKLKGLQKWWVNKKTLVTKLYNLLDSNYGEGYFTDPDKGHGLYVTFNKNVAAKDMYDILPTQETFSIPEAIVSKAVDPELFAPKVKPEKDIRAKLKEMFPTLDLDWT